MELLLENSEATENLGQVLAACLPDGLVVFLQGNLGAGKTTFVRGLLAALGHRGAVKSPTYTLVEPYDLEGRPLYHFDLYRLGDPEELEYMGGRDYFSEDAVCLVEWPEKAAGALPPADLVLTLEYLQQGRRARWQAGTPKGKAVLACMKSNPAL